VAKEDLKSYFRSLEVNKLLEEAENAQHINTMFLDLILAEEKNYLQFKINRYIYSLCLSSTITFYLIFYLGIVCLLGTINC